MSIKIAADDYGMSSEINQGISDLTRKGIVSKVSVVANESIQYQQNDIGEHIETGLHINLTLGALSPGLKRQDNLSPVKLIHLIYFNRFDYMQIADAILCQLQVLKNRKFDVSYFDTHQHIHVIPRVLDQMIKLARSEGIKTIRCITIEKENVFFYFLSLIRYGFFIQVPKMVLLYCMGKFMKRELDRTGMNYCKNTVLMPLATGGDYDGLLIEFKKRFDRQGIDAEIVSHPGLKAVSDHVDDYNEGRFFEYQSLNKLS